MTTFTTFFVGGTWDGRWGRTYGSRFHIVPLREDETGNANVFRYVPTFDEAMSPRPVKYIEQRYRRRFVVRDPDIRDDFDHPDGGVSHLVYVLEDE